LRSYFWFSDFFQSTFDWNLHVMFQDVASVYTFSVRLPIFYIYRIWSCLYSQQIIISLSVCSWNTPFSFSNFRFFVFLFYSGFCIGNERFHIKHLPLTIRTSLLSSLVSASAFYEGLFNRSHNTKW
jgi:hypothetical protein